MKYKLLIFLLVLFYWERGYSQDYLYEDCYIGASDIFAMAGTYNDAWTVTHGTPSYTAAATDIFMWHDGSVGEGVVRKFPFKPNTVYRVTIGLVGFVNNSGSGRLNIKLVNDYPEYYFGAMGTPIPSFPGARALVSSVVPTFFTSRNVCLVFKTGSSESYLGMAIYPSDNADMTLTCISIIGCTDISATGGATFCASSIPAGIYNYFDGVNIGSSFCSATSLTSNVPSANTIIESASYIEVKENTLLTPGNNGSALLNIKMACAQSLYADYPFPDPGMVYISYDRCSCLPTRPGGEYITNREKLDSIRLSDMKSLLLKEATVEIFPNPACQYLEFGISPSLHLKYIRIYNVMGQLVKDISYTMGVYRIDISELPPDNYYVEFHSETGVVRKKFTKI